MRKYILLSCLLLPVFSHADNTQQPTSPTFFEVSRDIQPGETNNFTVPLPRVKASCKINTHGNTVHFSGHIDKGELTLQTTVDGKPQVNKYHAGETITGFEAQDTQEFNIVIEGYAGGGLTLDNEDGTGTITARCSVSF